MLKSILNFLWKGGDLPIPGVSYVDNTGITFYAVSSFADATVWQYSFETKQLTEIRNPPPLWYFSINEVGDVTLKTYGIHA